VKLATWNVNSLRVRLPHLSEWLKSAEPDIVALQETKVLDEDFPREALEGLGYFVAFSGQKTYNGVALLSRWPIENTLTDLPALDDPQRRILVATTGSLRVVNLYVPNGSEVGSEKFVYKLDWLDKTTRFLTEEIGTWPNLVVMGDFNIAPEDRDVHDPEAWRELVLCSTPEREAFSKLLAAGFLDAFRQFDQPDASYTWWDYRAAAFRRNRGLRIDHILLGHALKPRLRGCSVDVGPRKLDRPSDHAPVVASIDPAD
jgi:exodeoxyribonuclease-3